MRIPVNDERYTQIECLLPKRIVALIEMIEDIADDDDDAIAAFVLYRIRRVVVESRIELPEGLVGIDYTMLATGIGLIYESIDALLEAFDTIDDPNFSP